MSDVAQDPVQQLLQIMVRLRDPETGCPWDKLQNFDSIAPYTIEEAYEVSDAIARRDYHELRAELGDLLLQVVFHARIAEEQQLFCFDDVARAICEKMLRRHPHVFGDSKIADEKAQSIAWEQHKRAERGALSDTSALAGIGSGLPEWQRALKLQKRAAAIGFDWPDLAPVFAKLREEVGELEDAVLAQESKLRLREELGDILFVAVNVARHLEIDPAQALAHGNLKFERRFRRMEALAQAQGQVLDGQNLAAQDLLWEQAKREEKP